MVEEMLRKRQDAEEMDCVVKSRDHVWGGICYHHFFHFVKVVKFVVVILCVESPNVCCKDRNIVVPFVIYDAEILLSGQGYSQTMIATEPMSMLACLIPSMLTNAMLASTLLINICPPAIANSTFASWRSGTRPSTWNIEITLARSRTATSTATAIDGSIVASESLVAPPPGSNRHG